MGSYATDLDYLFNFSNRDTKNPKPYTVDPYLYNYTTDAATFNSVIPMSGGANSYYYVGILSVGLTYESAASVDAIVGPVSFDANSTTRKFFNPTTLSASPTNLPAICNTQPSSSSSVAPPSTPQSSDGFDGDIEHNDILITINPTTDPVKINTTKKDIVKLIKERSVAYNDLSQRLSTPPSSTNPNANNISHTQFDSYLNDINKSISTVYLKQAYKYIVENEKETPILPSYDTSRVDTIQEADRIRLTGIGNLKIINIAWKLEPLMADLRAASKKTLYTIVTKSTSLDSKTFIQGFASRYSMANGSSKGYYYMYRTLMLDFFKLDKKLVFEEDGRVDMYSRKLLIDLFIKCCYPLIHYDLIDILMVRYTEKGDFVNARFALLAKCLFTFNIVNELVTTMPDGDVDVSIKTQFSTNLTAYIKRNNQGDLNSDKSTKEKIKEIVIDLHNMSNNVVSNSDHMELLKSAIKTNQLSMRNVSAAIEERKGDVTKKYIEFWSLIATMIILIASCGLLYFIEKYDIGLIVASSTVVSILAYKMILLIISLIMKN